MKRFPFVLLAVSVAAMTACTGTKAPSGGATGGTGATGATAAPAAQAMAPGHINVNVFCPGSPQGAGVRVLPWKVQATKGGQLTWNVPRATGMDSIVVAAVDPKQSPFPQDSFSLTTDSTQTPLSSSVQSGVTYRYKLTAVCGTETIVIDPEIIIT